MTIWLKQSTAVDIGIGPFVDTADGFTAMTGLTLTQPDIRLKKNGGAWAQKNAAQTLSHEENGWYEVAFDTTDTGTLGTLQLAVHESGALPVFMSFLVVAGQVWDSFFGADVLQVDVAQWLGTAAATPTVAGVPEVDVTHWIGTAPNALVSGRVDASVGAVAADAITAAAIANGAIDAATFAAGAIDATAIANGAIDAATFAAGAIDAAALAADAGTEIGTAVWATAARSLTVLDEDSTTLDLDATIRAAVGLATANLDTQLDALPTAAENATAVWGAGAKEITSITAAGLADFFLVDSTTTYASAVAGSVVKEIADNAGGSSLTVADIADAVWEEAIADHSGTAGSTAEALAATLGFADQTLSDLTGFWGAFNGGTTGPAFDGATLTFVEAIDELLSSSGATAADIADAVWAEALPGAYNSGEAGKIVGDNINATISSRATQTSLDTLDDFVDTEVGAIKTKTDFLPSATAGAAGGLFIAGTNAATTITTSLTTTFTGNLTGSVGSVTGLTASNLDATVSSRASQASVNTIDDFIDTEITALQTSVDDLPTNAELATALGTADDAVLAQIALVKAKTDNLPADPADASDIAAAFAVTNGKIDAVDDLLDTELPALTTAVADLPTNAELATALGTADDAVLTQVALVKAKTDLIPGTQDGKTFAETTLLMASTLLGKASGMATTTGVFRALDDSQDRVTATIDADGNRTAVTYDTTSP